jgi:hypothetical protein
VIPDVLTVPGGGAGLAPAGATGNQVLPGSTIFDSKDERSDRKKRQTHWGTEKWRHGENRAGVKRHSP